ncbi:MAG: geranylgeranyl reductase family protein [Nitrosopumilaceae archaeon]|nr:NAD(P)/FAD-dependent oxidoreductase [Nitrosopumilaceae archaeon]NIT99776.1 NAD(P)/FAD-dependent oxidoreductase [Nitrosopumilaceae archaeon]NIU88638.1 geranylgeranyl reductase family protein [Nitrosopumilaceae archaeon]NIV64912.1 geranylgeranyl reductase family protein [Nitrosopumilaceae archaeon]NIX60379.1 geranylgeranyl reductase family protein [Nitrosopumilaceae archaeon]
MRKSLEFDVVVVGGGPAGSSAAFAASKNGSKVALIEKEKEIAQTVRTSGVTWADAIKEFEIPRSCYNPIRNYGFQSNHNEVIINDHQPRAAVLDVRKTYRWLAEKARKEGTEIFSNTTVTGVIKNDKGDVIGVKTESDQGDSNFYARIIIDASGFQSIVARLAGYATRWKKFGVGAEYEMNVQNADDTTWWLMVGSRFSPAGYAWIFPLSKNRVRIGVGIGKPDSSLDPKEKLDELIKEKRGKICDLGKMNILEYHYGLIPNEGLSRQTVYNNLILVGDSAGQANPLVLEGIRYAIRFGRVAGQVASDSIKNNNTDAQALSTYEEHWRSKIHSKIKSAHKVQQRWLSLSDQEWDRELEIIRELGVEEFLDFIKADFGLSNIIKLASHHPKLAVRQLFNLVKGASK